MWIHWNATVLGLDQRFVPHSTISELSHCTQSRLQMPTTSIIHPSLTRIPSLVLADGVTHQTTSRSRRVPLLLISYCSILFPIASVGTIPRCPSASDQTLSPSPILFTHSSLHNVSRIWWMDSRVIMSVSRNFSKAVMVPTERYTRSLEGQ